MWQLKELRSSLKAMALQNEEALAAIGQMPSLGDYGVGETLVTIENLIQLAQLRLNKHYPDD